MDRIDRRDLDFGVDEIVWGDAADWAASLGDDGPEIVIEAIGHQAGTLEAAVEAVAPGGVVLAFGVPDEAHYSFPFARFFRKNATLIAGVTTDRRDALAAARDYLREHPSCSRRTSPTCSRSTTRRRRSNARSRPRPAA